jgi:hypothetical protein
MILKTKLEIIDAKLAELSEVIAKEVERCREELKQQMIDEIENEIIDVKPAKKVRR